MRCRWQHRIHAEVPADESPEMTEGYEVSIIWRA